jgi:hypothetical protein
MRLLLALLPWAALTAVTALALRALSERRRLEAGTATTDAPPPSPPASAVGGDAAIERALLDLARADASRRSALLAADAEAARARRAEEEAAVLAALLSARPPVAPSASPAPPPAPPPPPPLPRATPEPGPRGYAPLAWVEDAASGDAARLARARAAARAATPADLADLEALLAEAPSRAPAVAQLLPAVPAGGGAQRLAVAALLGDGAAGDADRIVGLVGLHLLEADALWAALGAAAPEVRRATLRWLREREPAWGALERARVARPLVLLLDAEDAGARAAAIEAVGILRLEGLAERLAPRLADGAPPVRAGAARALARVPLGAAEPAARAALARLLADEDLDVRAAGLALAERLVGRALDFDPAAPPAARAAALAALRPLLGE